jgi:hypothetical protein
LTFKFFVVGIVEKDPNLFDGLRDGLLGHVDVINIEIGLVPWHDGDDLVIIVSQFEIPQLLFLEFFRKGLPHHCVKNLEVHFVFDGIS